MSITQSLNNAISGLTATSKMVEVVSSNLSNALTEGYARREVDTNSGRFGGVRVTDVMRITDPGLLGDRRLADAALAFQQRSAPTLERLETQFSMPDDPAGLNARMAALEQALVTASGDPSSTQGLENVLTRLGEITDALNQNARDVQTMRQDADAAIAADIETLNTALKQVEALNADIQRLRAVGGDPSSLMDQRQKAVDAIASIVPIREIPRPNNQLVLMTTTGMQLLDGPAAQFTFTSTPTITADMTLASGGVSGVMKDGLPLSVTDGFGKLSGGSLASAFQLRDETLVSAQSALDGIAVDLISRFEDPAIDPTLTAGTPGLLTDSGAILDPADTVGLARRLSVNAVVDPAQGGDLWRLRDGIAAVAQGSVGATDQLLRWGDALTSPRSAAPGMPSLSATGQISRVANEFSNARLRSDEAVAFSGARRDALRQAELANGVDTDQELQSLLQIEQAYAANARLVQTIDQMIQTLMEI